MPGRAGTPHARNRLSTLLCLDTAMHHAPANFYGLLVQLPGFIPDDERALRARQPFSGLATTVPVTSRSGGEAQCIRQVQGLMNDAQDAEEKGNLLRARRLAEAAELALLSARSDHAAVDHKLTLAALRERLRLMRAQLDRGVPPLAGGTDHEIC